MFGGMTPTGMTPTGAAGFGGMAGIPGMTPGYGGVQHAGGHGAVGGKGWFGVGLTPVGAMIPTPTGAFLGEDGLGDGFIGGWDDNLSSVFKTDDA